MGWGTQEFSHSTLQWSLTLDRKPPMLSSDALELGGQCFKSCTYSFSSKETARP